MALEAQPPHPVGGGAIGQGESAGPIDRHLGVGRLLGRLRPIPPVGRQHGVSSSVVHQQRRVRTGETGQITHVDQVRYQHRVEFGRGQTAAQTVPAL